MKKRNKFLIIALLLSLLFPAATASAADYTVAQNDSLYSLSQLFKTSVSNLRKTNNFEENSLSPGDIIYVAAHVYSVKSGDSLAKIAKKYKIKLADLKKANWRTGDSIVAGEKLLIPGMKPTKKSDKILSCSAYEVDLLARLVEAEAGGETYQAKIAVAATVINRVQSGEWAPTIAGVINQKFDEYYQFTPVKNGMIRNTPSAKSVKAAWIALFGSDPSNNAIFYYDQSCKNEWLLAKQKTARLDHLTFAK